MLTLNLDSLPASVRDGLVRAASGEVVIIVDHGRTVARLIPESDLPDELKKAASEGGITLPAPGALRSSPQQVPPISGGGVPASAMVIEDRR